MTRRRSQRLFFHYGYYSYETEKPTRFRLPSFGVQVLAGLVLGVVLGLVARSIGADGVDATTGEVDPNWLTETLSTVGGTFVTLLRAVVPPLVFLAIVASIANLATSPAPRGWRGRRWPGSPSPHSSRSASASSSAW